MNQIGKYSSERNVQMLIYLLNQHKIRKVIASPGTTNINFVASVQFDDYFQVYSCVDERSAAYMACGMAEESGEPVVLTCTGATASRNYVPGLTEAYYRKIPVLAVTATQHLGRIGQNMQQVLDRSMQMKDLVNYSMQLTTIHSQEDEWAAGVRINEALLELRHNGGGPVHINLETQYNQDFSEKELKPVKVIRRYCSGDEMPVINAAKVGVFVGNHSKWSAALTEAVDAFCQKYNAVVFTDNTSNYRGKYNVLAPLMASQDLCVFDETAVDLLIDIGNITGASIEISSNEIWRVNPDGVIRDTYKKLTKVFQMEEAVFFNYYVAADSSNKSSGFLQKCKDVQNMLYHSIGDLPFSNVWIAQQTASKIPVNSIIHFGILNSLRAWNFFEIPESVLGYSNTGGFGIDGNVSSLIGASLTQQDILHFGIVGDLAFFYDINSLGNRHVSNNVRIMLINNGRGTEFRNYNHPAERFGKDADAYMAAAGHFGKKSHRLIRHYAEDMGYEYLSADSKESYLKNIDRFLTPEITDRPMLFEIFTDSKDESDAIYLMRHLVVSKKGEAKQVVKKVLGQKGISVVKKLIGRE